MRTSRHGGRARALAAGTACLLLFGCGPESADVIFGGEARSDTAAPVPVPANGLDGIYTGSAIEADGQVTCPTPLSISNFRVEGNMVHFGGFHGPISADGTVMIPFSSESLTGRFEGPVFNGHVSPFGYVGPVGCTYTVSVRRISA